MAAPTSRRPFSSRAELEVIVYNGQLLNLVLAEDLLGFLQGGALFGGDQMVLGHHVVNQLVHVLFKLHVPVGDDADELTVVADGHTGNAVFRHELVSLSQSVTGSQPEGVGNDAIFTALHHIHLLGLLADGHVLMDDADTALTGDGNGHPILGDCIHGGTHHRDVQADLFGELGVQVDVCGQDIALRGDQQHIVKGQTLPHELTGGIRMEHGLHSFVCFHCILVVKNIFDIFYAPG